jgi:hypothetical protein
MKETFAAVSKPLNMIHVDLWFHKTWEISWGAERLPVPQEGPIPADIFVIVCKLTFAQPQCMATLCRYNRCAPRADRATDRRRSSTWSRWSGEAARSSSVQTNMNLMGVGVRWRSKFFSEQVIGLVYKNKQAKKEEIKISWCERQLSEKSGES